MLTITTANNTIYKLPRQLITQHSNFIQTLFEDQSQQTQLHLSEITSTAFDFIYEYLQLHKTNPPLPVKQYRYGLKLAEIMEQADSQLIERCMLGGNSFIKDVYYAAMFLQMETLKERIIVGIGLTIKDKVELEDEENIREEIKNRVKKLLQKKVQEKKMKQQQLQLAQKNIQN